MSVITCVFFTGSLKDLFVCKLCCFGFTVSLHATNKVMLSVFVSLQTHNYGISKHLQEILQPPIFPAINNPNMLHYKLPPLPNCSPSSRHCWSTHLCLHRIPPQCLYPSASAVSSPPSSLAHAAFGQWPI